MPLVSELRRRQVFRAAAWYGGLAWLAIQVADTVVPRFGLPDWTVRAVIVAALLGLPLVLILAWFFDVSGKGLRRESALPSGAVTSAVWRIPSFWIALVLGVGLTVSAQQAWQRLIRPATEDRPSVAVLPFANMSPDPENAFFADGLQEEILATLARAGGLRVISRTSVEAYRDPKRSLREIADALDVDYVLEGSVRRAGDELRLTMQLIDGRTDEHVWAETYDRKFRDALQLQRTVAQQVAAEIGAKLSPAEKRLIAAVAPTVPEAYEPYVHALALWSQHAPEPELRAVISLLDESLSHDPGFALAYALRSKARIWLWSNFLGNDQEAAIIDAARADFERALQLQPGLPEALTARGIYYTYVAHDPQRALEDLTRALAISPNDPDSLNITGLTLRRLGRFDEALWNFREAARLTPGEERYAYRTFQTLLGLGRLDEAEEELQRFQQQFPAHPAAQVVKYWIRFLQTGETAGWRAAYERLAPLMDPVSRILQAERLMCATSDLASLAAIREAIDDTDAPDRTVLLALVYAELGDDRRARPHLEAMVKAARSGPEDPVVLANGAVALVLLGRRDEATRMADRALQLAPPETTDVMNYTPIASLRAWVLVQSGSRAEEGYSELERLVGGWGMATREVLVLPPWRLLRNDPRIREIVRRKLES